MIEKGAVFSNCRTYRYCLSRIWKLSKPYALFVCLNPSTADENIDDPTIRRCINYAEMWGYGGMAMVNLFAYRSTDPDGLRLVDDPIGPKNDFHIAEKSKTAGITIAAWGAWGAFKSRARKVMPMITDPHYLKLNQDGSPRHPLYLRKNLQPKRFSGT